MRSSCEAVLRANDRGSYTVPSPRLYPHQWAWDSAFAAIGWAHVDPARAWRELSTLMATAWRDGRIPHIEFHDRSGDYFPGPAFWETEHSSSISQPPVWATCARRVADITGDDAPLDSLLATIDASHRFFHEQRDPAGRRAVAVVHPWESGMDNSPAWDEPLAAIDPSDAPPFERRDTQVVGDATVRPTDDEYRRYAVLVKAIAKDGFGAGRFAVYDPFMTAVLARAEDDLAELCRRRGVPSQAARRAESLREGLEQLWDDQTGRYRYLRGSGEPIDVDVVGCYLPVACGVPADRASRLRVGLAERYAARFPIPSTSPSDPRFDPRRYWRGPTWVNVNWLLAPFVDGLRERTIALVRAGGMREYFHPETGEGLGAESFAWTAALVLDMLSG